MDSIRLSVSSRPIPSPLGSPFGEFGGGLGFDGFPGLVARELGTVREALIRVHMADEDIWFICHCSLLTCNAAALPAGVPADRCGIMGAIGEGARQALRKQLAAVLGKP